MAKQTRPVTIPNSKEVRGRRASVVFMARSTILAASLPSAVERRSTARAGLMARPDAGCAFTPHVRRARQRTAVWSVRVVELYFYRIASAMTSGQLGEKGFLAARPGYRGSGSAHNSCAVRGFV